MAPDQQPPSLSRSQRIGLGVCGLLAAAAGLAGVLTGRWSSNRGASEVTGGTAVFIGSVVAAVGLAFFLVAVFAYRKKDS